MNSDSSPIGHCPECGAELSPGQKLIEYEASAGTTGVFAECYSCDEVVRPE